MDDDDWNTLVHFLTSYGLKVLLVDKEHGEVLLRVPPIAGHHEPAHEEK